MTRRRPWSSEFKRWAAATVCGLLLLYFSPEGWAASRKLAAKVPAKHAAKKVLAGKASPFKMASGPEIGAADVLDDNGLHGSASFYSDSFHGRRTATGEVFDIRLFTGASNHFPLGTLVAVQRLDGERCAIVKINDRMHARHKKRVIDVSRGVAEYLDMIRAGVVLVRVAPLKAAGGRDEGACLAAFDQVAPHRPESHGRPEKWPGFADQQLIP